MPELPEVEVVKKSLHTRIRNLTIKNVVINNINLRYKIHPEFSKIIKGTKILSVKRRSKYLFINLKKGISVMVHLGMTGKFFLKPKKKEISHLSFYYLPKDHLEKHDHLKITLSNNCILIYNDIRRFGFIKIVKTKKIQDNFHIKNLGPEPLSKKFNIRYCEKYVNKRNTVIKNLLMSQKFLSGLGNIYVNEILYLSKINPFKKASTLNKSQLNDIIKYTKITLKKAVMMGGSSIRNFNNTEGDSGSFQNNFKVYAREGLKCKRRSCKNLINKKVISKRSTFFCDKCQN
tara:strand:- start:3237 stop:4103 length:867 start_codon:yes stop_codon:yes gene_type:complete